MTRYVVGVSGGVDSVVLLSMAVESYGADRLVVAHFDHGIRPNSADDMRFVRALAKQYGVLFETKREDLGAKASEEVARDRRYAFLRDVANKHEATIMTAHHADDAIETMAINLVRGTGWRGIAVLDNDEVARPLLDRTKSDLIAYARRRGLSWREDETNADTKYLRNALRQKLKNFDADSQELLHGYRKRQLFLKREIEAEAAAIVGTAPYSRYMLTSAGDSAATELLRMIFVNETGLAPTRPQLARALLAVKTYMPAKRFEVMRGVKLRFMRTTFVVEVAPPVLS